jgi:CRISPR-associated protein Csx17
MTNKILLRGCAPEPLIHYLKALGVIRIVAEQLDKIVRGAWTADGFMLETTATEDELVRFFLDKYEPTPIVAPWNNSSGFYPKDKKARGYIEKLFELSDSRFEEFYSVVETARKIIGERTEAPKDNEKMAMMQQARCLFPEKSLAWLDAAFVLGTEKPDYLPLLGSGGNDGNFSFTTNLFEKWLNVLSKNNTEKQQTMSQNQLDASLFLKPAKLEKAAIGQFHPGGAGGANASQGVDGDFLVNPWDFIFIIEGSLVLASATVRQLQSGARSRASFPFTAGSSTIGYGTATSGEKIRAEMWLPLWSNLTSYAEISHIFKEGRVQFNSSNRRARSGFDFARAVAELGVDRGIEAFQLYAFIERNGQANLATPLGVFEVPKKERVLTSLLNDLDKSKWLNRIVSATKENQKPDPPPRFIRVRKQIEEASFKLCCDGSNDSLREVFISLGNMERELSNGLSFCSKKGLSPLTNLSTRWSWESNDGSDEFHVAQALASIVGDKGKHSIRENLESVEFKNNNFVWSSDSTSAIWSAGDLVENLSNVLQRRSIDARKDSLPHPPLQSKRYASLETVAAFLNGETDDEQLEDYLFALSLINWRSASEHEARKTSNSTQNLPRIYALLKLLFLPKGEFRRGNAAKIEIKHEPSIIPLLRAERITDVLEIAERRLKSSGIAPLTSDFYYPQEEGARLAAALLIPIDQTAIEEIAKLILSDNEEI